MIEAIYRFGKFMAGDKKTEDFMTDKVEADRLIILEFDSDGNFMGISDTRNISGIESKLLYKKVRASRRCNSNTPTFFLNIKHPEKSIRCLESIFNWLKKYSENIVCIKNYEKVKEELLNYLKNFPPEKNEKILLTTTFNGKFPGEIESIVKAFKIGYMEEFEPVEGVCSLCGKRTKVSGKKSPYAFYTLDKIGYISGFSEKNHERGFPVCIDCFLLLDFAKKVIASHKFSLTKYAPSYWLIPDLVLTEVVDENTQEVFKNIFDLEFLKRKLNLTNKEKLKLSDTDEDILDVLKELKDTVSFHFIFLKINNSQEQIRLYIQDVYPSRIKKLFEVKSAIESVFKPEKEFTFSTIGQFFWKWDRNSRSRDLEEFFLELIDSIFRKVPYSENLLIKILLNGIRQTLLDELLGEKLKTANKAFDALLSYLFVKATTEETMINGQFDNLDKLLEELPLLKTEESKGIFLLGVLTQRLIDKQAASRDGSKPFLKKLSGLKMNERGFKKLMTELREKMEAYEIFKGFERELFDMASEYFAKAPSPWKLNVDEMNFIFAVGMGMKSRIYKTIFEKEEEND
ncbi:TIGR02556 family CRISPR-associated protein [Desulfurobacterium atlanticum]|uniref:CRISPR-associated protein, Csh1 family n=1 Tax=Desulfurobacterium atlanticum TaxID=240169 RepID=A0A239A3X1_9BACT|nr:TIGR02556 family CRISPR-associated protein [Desulfurobacterium atlanticum]SNR89603.1 CRISPR-associated protein, Csh1 family [Desulfurobacterium atlanticum]